MTIKRNRRPEAPAEVLSFSSLGSDSGKFTLKCARCPIAFYAPSRLHRLCPNCLGVRHLKAACALLGQDMAMALLRRAA